MNALELIHQIASKHYEYKTIILSEGDNDTELTPMGAIELLSSGVYNSFTTFKVSSSLENNHLICWVL